ncbi:hypothetical protein AGR7C_Lc20135 [Agrobacterium deltaense Zutra 3/1]|uniref:Uncharacterized protein n=1 Tax=Agrobacterium deltaense Zutra 3/1 TaxID=1183427 RepID=A0A1S7RMH5_9HYPH|nr:hypothetical protein AGR7C_Lc20135 [Agrobacterium deltaense Zutra 3/1]
MNMIGFHNHKRHVRISYSVVIHLKWVEYFNNHIRVVK